MQRKSIRVTKSVSAVVLAVSCDRYGKDNAQRHLIWVVTFFLLGSWQLVNILLKNL